MPTGNNAIRRDRASTPGRVPTAPRVPLLTGPAAAATAPATVVLIESNPQIRSTINQLLNDWGLRVMEANLDSSMPVRDEHAGAAAIIADFELGAGLDRPPPFNGLDIALLIRRRAARNVPILVTSDNYGRHAIPACSPHRIPVIFKPVAAEFLRGWLVLAALLTDSPPWPKVGGHARSAA
jgi:DNA-binding NtrC family response regulator